MSTRVLARLIFSSSKYCRHRNVTLSRIALRYYRDSVTVILTAPSLQTYVMSRAVTEHCHAESPVGRVQSRGGTLGFSGWGCAAGTLEPLTYTRASSAEFCYPILE